MTQTLYYVQMDEEVYGPYTLDTLRSIQLTPDIQVLSSASNMWNCAGEYPELADYVYCLVDLLIQSVNPDY